MADVETIAATALYSGTSINQFAIIGSLLFTKETNTFQNKELLHFIREFYLKLFDNKRSSDLDILLTKK